MFWITWTSPCTRFSCREPVPARGTRWLVYRSEWFAMDSPFGPCNALYQAFFMHLSPLSFASFHQVSSFCLPGQNELASSGWEQSLNLCRMIRPKIVQDAAQKGVDFKVSSPVLHAAPAGSGRAACRRSHHGLFLNFSSTFIAGKPYPTSR